MTTNEQKINVVKTNARALLQRANDILAIVNNNVVKVPRRFSISYTLGNQGVTRIFNESEIYAEESRLADSLRSIGVAEFQDDSIVEHQDGVLSYLLDEDQNPGPIIIISGSRIRYTFTSPERRARHNSYTWKNLSDNVQIIINRLPETVEERKLAEAQKAEEIIAMLTAIGAVDKNGDVTV